MKKVQMPHKQRKIIIKGTMITAILLFILIVIAIAVFYLGLFVGGWAMSKRLADATGRAILESDLTRTEQKELIDKIKKYAKENK